MKIVKQSVEFLTATPNALELIERAGRLCYKSEPEGDMDGFIRKRIKSGHTSILEHASVSYQIVCDRGVSHEIVRHRIASYSQESTRYCNYSKEKFDSQITVIAPTNDPAWLLAMGHCEDAYFEMLKNGHAPQIARAVLPNSLKTEIIMTINFRSIRNFFFLRTAPGAHPQMREIANLMLADFRSRWPVIVEDLA